MSPSKQPSLRTYSSDSVRSSEKPGSILSPQGCALSQRCPDTARGRASSFSDDSNVQPGLGALSSIALRMVLREVNAEVLLLTGPNIEAISPRPAS